MTNTAKMVSRNKQRLARIERARALAEQDGLSQTQIARALGTSTSAVAGLVRRYGIKLKRGVGNCSGTRKRDKQKDPAKAAERLMNKMVRHAERPLIVEELENADIRPPTECTFDDLTLRSCRYPYGRGSPYTFCGAAKPAHEDIPYCRLHRRLCYQPSKPMKPNTWVHYNW